MSVCAWNCTFSWFYLFRNAFTRQLCKRWERARFFFFFLLFIRCKRVFFWPYLFTTFEVLKLFSRACFFFVIVYRSSLLLPPLFVAAAFSCFFFVCAENWIFHQMYSMVDCYADMGQIGQDVSKYIHTYIHTYLFVYFIYIHTFNLWSIFYLSWSQVHYR